MTSAYRTRFAPSPTGYLHVGHAYAARQAFDAADRAGGECLLRLEDIDQTRCRPAYETALLEDLHWLGLSWPEPVRRQSDHFEDFQQVIEALRARGLVYRCFLTRKALQAELDRRDIGISPAGERPYPGPEKLLSVDEVEARLADGEGFAWRLSLARCRDLLGQAFDQLTFEETGDAPDIETGLVKAHPDWLGDVLLARKDTPVSYHLAVCHDDAIQKISHIVRGADLYFATHIHVLLQAIMRWPTPIYQHHKLLLDEHGRKFSKTDRSKTLRSLREEGVRPDEILEGFPI